MRAHFSLEWAEVGGALAGRSGRQRMVAEQIQAKIEGAESVKRFAFHWRCRFLAVALAVASAGPEASQKRRAEERERESGLI